MVERAIAVIYHTAASKLLELMDVFVPLLLTPVNLPLIAKDIIRKCGYTQDY